MDNLPLKEANEVRSCAYHINRLLARRARDINLITFGVIMATVAICLLLYFGSFPIWKLPAYGSMAAVFAFLVN